ncbi:hypothetical protein GM3708_999 [Geminocystis sp. NIES-3708]|uniref:hypothetical protein n=1 Tax=Geminocystis sp. NIES-3708 TaxID=1615909 RepID=UPI0005FCC5E6|nr:hypothetical protein [Geminocystis sp. NIES-3708]BAQ60593.1 hypothetical protein GM3708_999 [Geminocystis sp. NIES-3708]
MKINRNSSPKNFFLLHLLKTQGSHKSNQEQGYILVIALGVVLALSGLMALYAKTNNQSEKETSTAAVSSNSGFYGAEAQLNIRANRLREKFLDYGTPQGTSPSKADACFDNNANQGSGDFACEDKTIESPDQKMSDTLVTTYVTEKNGGVGVKGKVPQGDAYQGLSMLEVGHSIYALSFKETDINNQKDGKQATAILQMDVKSRLIPMFQFAAFYTEDLEIFPSPPMTLSGPVHTNGNLYMGSSNGLDLKAQVTTVKDIFHSRKNTTETFPDGRVRVANAGGSLLNLLFNGTGSTTQTTNFMDPVRLNNIWGSQIKVRTDAPVSIPKPSILNNEGDYYKKADIRIEYKPVATSTTNLSSSSTLLTTIPFAITAIDRSGTSPVEINLSQAQLNSLRKPVLVSADLAKIPASTPLVSPITSTYGTFNICTPILDNALPTISLSGITVQVWWNTLTTAQKNAFRLVAQDYLQTQIQSQNAPVRFSLMGTALKSINTTDTFLTNFGPTTAPTSFSNDSRLTAQFTTTASRTIAWNNLREMNPQQIAGLREYTGLLTGTAVADTSRCYISAPVTDIGRNAATHKALTRFYNEREGRDMRILQLNIQSLAIWNHQGVYLNGTNLVSANELLYKKANADTSAPVNSFQRLGLAAQDTSDGGLVIHATIDNTTYSTAKTKQSPYGFALTGGRQLLGLGKTTTYKDPTGMTIATDQGLYVQGDYNVGEKDYHTGQSADLTNPTTEANAKVRVHNKQPAAFLADTFYPLTNACLNQDRSINHFTNVNCDNGIGDAASKITSSHTEQNAAILSGTDISGKPGAYNGGLENYPRFLENWSNKEWRYRGSFVSISIPLYAQGAWGGGNVYSPPLRPWDYDIAFNDIENLPPLTPQFVVLKQESFIRSFDQ